MKQHTKYNVNIIATFSLQKMFLSLSTSTGRDVVFNSRINLEVADCPLGGKAARDPLLHTRHTQPASTWDLHQHQCNRAAGQISCHYILDVTSTVGC